MKTFADLANLADDCVAIAEKQNFENLKYKKTLRIM